MNEEARELARQFFRKWSTHELTPGARKLLLEDVANMRILFAAYNEDPVIFDNAETAPNREWFAKKFTDL